MARTIWKFPLAVVYEQTIEMPDGAEVLHVAEQHGFPCAWALVDPVAPLKPRGFRILGTGHSVSDELGRHLGSFFIQGGLYVFHVFERGLAPDHAEDTHDAGA